LAITLYGRGISLNITEETPDNGLVVQYNGATIAEITSAGISGMAYSSANAAGSGVFAGASTAVFSASKWLKVTIGGVAYYVPATSATPA
jgi:hypothetical protein